MYLVLESVTGATTSIDRPPPVQPWAISGRGSALEGGPAAPRPGHRPSELALALATGSDPEAATEIPAREPAPAPTDPAPSAQLRRPSPQHRLAPWSSAWR